jgi:hypothetical protein
MLKILMYFFKTENIKRGVFNISESFFLVLGAEFRALGYARQMFYHLSNISSPFIFILLLRQSSYQFAQAGFELEILASPSPEVGITGVGH